MKRLHTLIILFVVLGLGIGYYEYKKIKKRRPKYSTIQVDETVFLQKINNGASEWMKKQIERDLSPFQNGITHKMLDTTFCRENIDKYDLARLRIIDGKLCWDFPEKITYSKGFNQTIKAIEALHARKPLPNLDMVFCFVDNMDDLKKEYPGPVFIFAKLASEDRLILLPDPKALTGYKNVIRQMEEGAKKYPWKDKKSLVYWRGATTGGYYDFSNWKNYPRSQLVLQSLEYPSEIDARFTSVIQCDSNLPKYLKKLGACSHFEPLINHFPHKYLIDVDGNTTTYERCFWELLSNCVTFKHASPYIQWYYGALEPYVHYIPVSYKMEDLIEKVQWAKEHDIECQQIAENATKFVKDNLMAEDNLVYVYELLNSYAKLLKD